MIGFFLSVLFLLFCLVCVIYTAAIGGHKGSTSSGKESRYAQSRNYMDFDPGTDSDKVGNPSFPNAGTDSVMHHEFMEDLLDNGKH